MEPRIDFSKHTLSELVRAERSLDRLKYPNNYRLLHAELASRPDYEAYLQSQGQAEVIAAEKAVQTGEFRLKLLGVFAILQMVSAALSSYKFLLQTIAVASEETVNMVALSILLVVTALCVTWFVGAYKFRKFSVFGWRVLMTVFILELVQINSSFLIWDWNLNGGLQLGFDSAYQLLFAFNLYFGNASFKVSVAPPPQILEMSFNLVAFVLIGWLLKARRHFGADHA